MKTVRIGIIGAGNMARKHLAVIQALDNAEAVGITSRTMSKAHDVAKEFTISICVSSPEELVKKAQPDALMVLVSENQMTKVVQNVLSFRRPLFIEKPAGLTLDDNTMLAEEADKKGVPTMVGFNRRYYSIYKKGIDIINQHGPLLGLAIEGHERMWRIRDGGKFSEHVMEQWLYANSTHTIDLLRYFGGNISQIHSFARSIKEKKGDQFVAAVAFENGAIGTYQANWYSPGGWKVLLYGDGVTVEYKPLESGRWIDKKFNIHEIKPDEIDINFKPGLYRQLEAFTFLVRDNKKDDTMLDLKGSCKTMQLAQHLSSNVLPISPIPTVV
ncbi:MAG: hypothetical protein GF384_05315 [Elusimicrobia bacterium]|nr:hypothetical protein [Elusimicrobiota bacterium]